MAPPPIIGHASHRQGKHATSSPKPKPAKARAKAKVTTTKPDLKMRAVPYDAGWGPLFEGCLPDLETPVHVSALSADSSINMSGYADAYEKAGMGPAPREALDWLTSQGGGMAQADVIPWIGMQKRLKQAALHIHTVLAHSSPKGSLVFMLDAAPSKSNTFIFLLLMKYVMLQAASSTSWRAVRSRMWAAYTPQTFSRWSNAAGRSAKDNNNGAQAGRYENANAPTPPREPPKPWTIVFADDCAYSGSQMASLVARCTRSNNPSSGPTGDAQDDISKGETVNAIEAVTVVMLMYGTEIGTHRVMEACPQGSSVFVMGSLGGVPDPHKLMRNDVALCLQSAGDPARWMVTTLFSLITLIRYDMHAIDSTWLGDGTWSRLVFLSRDSNFTVIASRAKPCLTAFQHKLPDNTSIPFDWFLLGPTLRTFVSAACRAAPCDLSAHGVGEGLKFATVPFQSLIHQLDRSVSEAKKAKAVAATSPPVSRKQTKGKTANNGEGRSGGDVALYSYVTLHTPTGDQGCWTIDNAVMRLASGFKEHPEARISSLPYFVPLLSPTTACGAALAVATSDTNDQADATAWGHVQLTTEAIQNTIPCVEAPYRVLLKEAFKHANAAAFASIWKSD